MAEKILDERTLVKMYLLVPSSLLGLFPEKILSRMYDQAINQAIVEYETPLMSGEAVDFKDIASVTVMLEKEMVRRKLDKKPLNPNNQIRKVYATDVWSSYA